MIAVTANETTSINPRLAITEKEKRSLFFSIFNQPFFGLGLSPQMVLIESCISCKYSCGSDQQCHKTDHCGNGALAAYRCIGDYLLKLGSRIVTQKAYQGFIHFSWAASCPKNNPDKKITMISKGAQTKKLEIGQRPAELRYFIF